MADDRAPESIIQQIYRVSPTLGQLMYHFWGKGYSTWNGVQVPHGLNSWASRDEAIKDYSDFMLNTDVRKKINPLYQDALFVYKRLTEQIAKAGNATPAAAKAAASGGYSLPGFLSYVYMATTGLNKIPALAQNTLKEMIGRLGGPEMLSGDAHIRLADTVRQAFRHTMNLGNAHALGRMDVKEAGQLVSQALIDNTLTGITRINDLYDKSGNLLAQGKTVLRDQVYKLFRAGNYIREVFGPTLSVSAARDQAKSLIGEDPLAYYGVAGASRVFGRIYRSMLATHVQPDNIKTVLAAIPADAGASPGKKLVLAEAGLRNLAATMANGAEGQDVQQALTNSMFTVFRADKTRYSDIVKAGFAAIAIQQGEPAAYAAINRITRSKGAVSERGLVQSINEILGPDDALTEKNYLSFLGTPEAQTFDREGYSIYSAMQHVRRETSRAIAKDMRKKGIGEYDIQQIKNMSGTNSLTQTGVTNWARSLYPNMPGPSTKLASRVLRGRPEQATQMGYPDASAVDAMLSSGGGMRAQQNAIDTLQKADTQLQNRKNVGGLLGVGQALWNNESPTIAQLVEQSMGAKRYTEADHEAILGPKKTEQLKQDVLGSNAANPGGKLNVLQQASAGLIHIPRIGQDR